MIGRAIASLLRGYIWITPEHPGRGLLGKLAWRLDSRIIVHEVSPGTKLNLRMNNNEHITYWTSRYEEHGELSVFLELLRPDMTVVDIGANIGMYACSIGRRVGPQGKVFAFEPMPDIFQQLVANVALNAVSNVTTHQLAICDRVGHAQFHVGSHDSIGSLTRPTGGKGIVEVETITLDDFLQQHGVDRVDAIKIDVEGAESLVLRGMKRLLQTSPRPILLVEHNHPALQASGTSAEQLFASILEYGYQPHAILKGKLVPVTGLIEPSHRTPEATMNYVFLPSDG